MFGGFRGRHYYEPSVNSSADKTITFYRYSSNWVAFSWFAGFGLIVYTAFQTFITIDSIFHLFVICGVVATGVHYYLTQGRTPDMLPAMAFYNFVGIACIACGLLLTLNLTIRGEEQQQVIPIAEVKQKQIYDGRMRAEEVTLARSDLQQFKYVMDFQQWRWNEFRDAKALEVTYERGILGFPVYKRARLVAE